METQDIPNETFSPNSTHHDGATASSSLSYVRNKVIMLTNLDPNGSRQDIQTSFEKLDLGVPWVDHTKDSTCGYVRLKNPLAREISNSLMSQGGLRIGSEMVKLRALEGAEEDTYWALFADRSSHESGKKIPYIHKSFRAKVRLSTSQYRNRYTSIEGVEDSKLCNLKVKAQKTVRYLPYTRMDIDKGNEARSNEISKKKRRKKKKKVKGIGKKRGDREQPHQQKQGTLDAMGGSSSLPPDTMISSLAIETSIMPGDGEYPLKISSDQTIINEFGQVNLSRQQGTTQDIAAELPEDILKRFEKLYLDI
ncbi:hypothetical protein G9A89_006182 [Geosiphon pyriformis]|nr:hypothetical protein G9A89_006182 [Geosiphon pyriformis]